MKTRSIIAPVTLFALAAGAWAQDTSVEVKTATTNPVLENISAISREWWITAVIASFLLAMVLGFFMYRSKVHGAQAGAATGCGCGVAAGTFVLLLFAIVITLAFTMFNVADQVKSDLAKSDQEQAKPTTGGLPPAATTGTQPPSTTGDDF
ncbi:MAG TPA: hypothetical protein VK934_13325 [Fimbriimonas sp.]|nr:hypothetical protein [Fimbriimonas sp.]